MAASLPGKAEQIANARYARGGLITKGHGMRNEVRKRFFFEKKKQKTFIRWALGDSAAETPTIKSFLVLFFKKEPLSFLIFLFFAFPALADAPPDTLAAVRSRGQLVCGIATQGVGFSIPDDKGVWRGLDADYCRAFAAAILGGPDKLRFVPTTTQQRFTALQSGEVDVLSRDTTWTFTRDVGQGLTFVGVNLYDGQGFIVKKSAGVKSAKELDGATICLLPGTTSELNVEDYFRANKINFKPVIIEQAADLEAAFIAGRCDAYSTDRSVLAGFRTHQGEHQDDFVILPEILSKEPVGPLVRQGDSHWFSIIRWVHFALIDAEELGVTQANVDQMKSSSTDPQVRRLLGVEGDFGKQLGLDNDWAVNAIKAGGNYGEIWQRNQGVLGVDRGPNRLWKDGGLQYAPPLR